MEKANKDKITTAERLVNWSEISRVLSGQRTLIARHRYSKKYRLAIKDLIRMVDGWVSSFVQLSEKDEKYLFEQLTEEVARKWNMLFIELDEGASVNIEIQNPNKNILLWMEKSSGEIKYGVINEYGKDVSTSQEFKDKIDDLLQKKH